MADYPETASARCVRPHRKIVPGKVPSDPPRSDQTPRPPTARSQRAPRGGPAKLIFRLETGPESSCRESKALSFYLLRAFGKNQREPGLLHPRGYPKGVTGACVPAITEVSPPPNRLFYGRCASCPATNFASAGLFEIQSLYVRCTRFSISEFASLVRKSYSSAQSR